MKHKKVAKNITKKENTYYANFTNSNGKRIRRSLGKDLPQAKIKLAQLQADIGLQNIAKGESIPSSGKSVKLALNAFINHAYGISDAWDKKKFDQGSERQAQMVMNLLVKYFNHANINNVSQARLPQMMRFIDDRAKYVRNATLRKNIQWLQRFFQYCEDMDYVVKSYARGLKKPKVDIPERYSFQQLEVDMLLDNAGTFRDYYILAISTGLRPCDMKNLTKADFDIKGDFMRLKIVSEKTKKPVYIPISKQARMVVESSETEKLFPNAHEEQWLKALRYNLYSNFDESYVKKHNIRLHTLRHTFATDKLNAGVPKEVIQNFLGHASVKTTEIYCNQMSDDSLAEWVDKSTLTYEV